MQPQIVAHAKDSATIDNQSTMPNLRRRTCLAYDHLTTVHPIRNRRRIDLINLIRWHKVRWIYSDFVQEIGDTCIEDLATNPISM